MVAKKKKTKIKWEGLHHKKIITSLDDLSLRGKYMSIKLNSLLYNVVLRSAYEESEKSFILIEVVYHNLWDYRLNSSATGSTKMIDSDDFQHDGDGCHYDEYTNLRINENNYKKVSFPWPELILEAGAKTKGWTWFDGLPKGVLPHRFIFKFQVFEPGDTSGWVQDQETYEFVLGDNDLQQLFDAHSRTELEI
jgi:hypothetical protein